MVFSTIAGYDEKDPATGIAKRYSPKFRKLENFQGMRFGYSEQFLDGLSEDHLEIFERSLKKLEKLGGRVIKVDFPHLKEIWDIELLFYEFPKALENYLKDKDISVKNLNDLVRFNLRHKEAIKHGQSILLKSSAYDINSSEYIKTLLKDRKYSRSFGIDLVMSENDLTALIFPANHGALISAKAGYPSINVPAGFSKKDGPFGITFSGSFLDDEKLYTIADLYFRKFSKDIWEEED